MKLGSKPCQIAAFVAVCVAFYRQIGSVLSHRKQSKITQVNSNKLTVPSKLPARDRRDSTPNSALFAWLGRVNRVDLVAWLILAMILALVLATDLRSPEKDDVAWLLYVARKWLAGQHLYSDLVEVNPPLIIWLYAVPAWIATTLSVPPKWVAVPSFAALVLGAAWWTASVLHRRAEIFARRVPVFSLIGSILLILPGVEFGQREHLMVATLLPYLAAMAIWMQGGSLSRRHEIIIGVVAGLGCALKPTFAIALVLPEIYGWLRGRPILRPAPFAGAAAALIYAGCIVLFCPAYLDRAVPLALALYGGTDTPLPALIDSASSLLLGIVVLCLIWSACYRRRSIQLSASKRPLVDALFVVLTCFAAGATIAYFIAGKDWFYHRIPAIVAIVLALVLWGVEGLPAMIRASTRDTRRRGFACAILASLALVDFAHGQVQLMRPWIAQAVEPSLSTEVRLEKIIRHEHARTYLAFSEWIGLGFPVVDNTGVVWTSRFDSMWALRGELWRARHDGRDPKAWPIRKWVANDFVKGCPDIVVVDSRSGINFVGVLVASDATFAKAWTHYHEIAAFDGLRVLKRQSADCSPGKSLPRVASMAFPTP